ncbi:MAG TPA: acyltransferase [Planctomycetaceae bacterium]|nr:acyltransferase [Planctomycetaceae bacterium]
MKAIFKPLFRFLCTLLILPFIISHYLLSRLGSADRSLETHSQILSLLPGLTGSYLRVAFYRFTLEHCAPTATIGFGVLFSKAEARIGNHVYIGPRCLLGLVTLEDDVLLGPMVQIPSGPNLHGFERPDIPIRDQPGMPRRVTIGRDSWIGGGSVVLADIADQTVVGAGSVVTKPYPPRSILAGIPAKVIQTRT